MNQTELFNEVRGWLEKEKLTFQADDENTCIQLRMNLDHALIPVRLLCEESPAMLQVVCSIPVKVPKEIISGTGLVLHRLNARLRVGSFQLDAEDGLVMFRLAQPIHPESELDKQFCRAFGTALNTVDNNLPPLCLHVSSTSKARELLDRLNPPTKKLTGTKSIAPHARFELN
jgi:hypothetical protein